MGIILEKLKAINCWYDDFGDEVFFCFSESEEEIVVEKSNLCDVYLVYENIEEGEIYEVTVEEYRDEDNELKLKVIDAMIR